MEVVLRAFGDRGRELIQELAGLGIFWETDFRDVVRGTVGDFSRFLDELERRTPFSLSRLTPIKVWFQFLPDQIFEESKKRAEPLVDEINRGETFCVRFSRRGLKGAFSAMEIAKEFGTFICKRLKDKYGVKPNADLEDADKALIFETIGKWCGVGSVSKEMRRKYRYLRLP